MRRFRVLAVAVSLLCFSAVAGGQESGGGAQSGGGGQAERQCGQQSGGGQQGTAGGSSGGRAAERRRAAKDERSGATAGSMGDGRADGGDADGAERAYEYATGNISGRDRAACHIGDERAAGFDAGSHADDDARSVDGDVPCQRVCGGRAAIEPARRRQIFLDELVHAHGAAARGAGHVDRARDAEPGAGDDRGPALPAAFSAGETAYGTPIADGQHPHDLFMEIAALYDLKLGERTLLSFYAAPVGDPAIGPAAYPHRASAIENPVAALGHHQEDSTHIADDVVTVGLAYRIVRIEASGFHGREPDEFRWDIDQGKIDSWASRLTVQPGKNWSAQYSYGRIASPEALFPGEDQERMTASVMYNRPLENGPGSNGNWASTLLWGRTRSLADGAIFNSYLAESTATVSYAELCLDANRERRAVERINFGRARVASRLRGTAGGAGRGVHAGIRSRYRSRAAPGFRDRSAVYGLWGAGCVEGDLRRASGGRHHVRAPAAVFRAGEIGMVQSSS